MFHCGLVSIDFEGLVFTWTNRAVWQRLDKVLINQEWSSVYVISKVTHLARGRSDHAPLSIKYGSERSVVSAFTYLNLWSRHPIFLKVVEEAWRESSPVCNMHDFFRKSLSVRKKL